MTVLLAIIDFIMPARWYIIHEDWSTGRGIIQDNYFGPFTKRGAEERLEDDYAGLLAYGDDEVYATKLSWSEARAIPFIASKKFWDAQAENLADDEPPIWEQ